MMAGVAVRVMYVDVEVKFLSLTFDCRKKNYSFCGTSHGIL
jgi:hypothetical protein